MTSVRHHYDVIECPDQLFRENHTDTHNTEENCVKISSNSDKNKLSEKMHFKDKKAVLSQCALYGALKMFMTP